MPKLPVYFSLIFLLLITATSCQQHRKTEQEDVAYWRQSFLDSASSLLYKDKDTTRALHYYDSAAKKASDLTVFAKAARFDLVANYYYFFTGNNKATASVVDSELAVYSTYELQNHYPRSYVGLLLFGGNIAYRLNQYSKANEYYFRAKMLGDAHLTPCERTPFNYSIAMVLYRQQDYQASLSYFKEAYHLQQSCAPQTFGVILQQQEIQSNIGLCYAQLKKYDSALIHFDKALEIANNHKDSLGPVFMDRINGVIYGNKAKVYMAMDQLKDAESFSLKSIALNDRDGYEKENALVVKLQLADVYGREKRFSSMEEILHKISAQMSEANARNLLEWNRLMASYFEQTASQDSAVIYLKKYFFLQDSLAVDQMQLTAADVARQLRDKEQTLQIAKLTKNNERTFVSLLVTIVFSCMAMVIIYLVYQNYRRSKKNLAVSRALNEEIKKHKAAREEAEKQRHKFITEAVIQAQETERSLIGLELHDNINQVLTTVKLHNEMVLEGVGEAQYILPRTVKYLQECINEIRSLSKRLSAPTLGKISLKESVADLIDTINETSKVKITFQSCGLEHQLLKRELHLGIYRILQEQLNNVLKHAEASEVFVHLECDEEHVRLSVTDNGKGFIPKSNKNGIGLINMQTRAESLNGSFEIESIPGRGCSMKVVVPVFDVLTSA